MASRQGRRGCRVGKLHTMYMGAAQAHHTPHEIAQRRHAQRQGQAQQMHATRAWEAQARIIVPQTLLFITVGPMKKL